VQVTTAGGLHEAVRDAWAVVPAPPAEDLRYVEWGWGEEAARALVGVPPTEVDLDSRGFRAATPLLDLPPRAAAAYLGTYLMSLLQGLDRQLATGLFEDVLSRAHTLTCLTLSSFWEQVIPLLPVRCRDVLADVVAYLASVRTALALTDEQVDAMTALASNERSGRDRR
jgi:hypothetical protein